MVNEKLNMKIISKIVFTCNKNVVSFQRSLGHYDFCGATPDPTNVNA